MFKNYLFLSSFLVSFFMMAQNDTIRKNNGFDSSKGFLINAKLINQNVDLDYEAKDISYLFYSKKKPLSMANEFDAEEFLNPNAPKRNFMYGPEPINEDEVLVVKHFDGNNNSVKSFKTFQNLGTIKSNTKFVRIEYKDFGLVDGDRVKVFLNKKEVSANIHLDGLYYTLHIKLEEKGYNRIDIQAINTGYVGPNTAEFIVYDDKGNIIAHDAWLLKKGAIATLGIVKF